MFVLQVAAAIGSYSSAGALKHCIVLLFCIHWPGMKASLIWCLPLSSSKAEANVTNLQFRPQKNKVNIFKHSANTI